MTCTWYVPSAGAPCGQPLAPGAPGRCKEHVGWEVPRPDADRPLAFRKPSFRPLAMVLDVESVGLHGEGFMAAWVVVDLARGGAELTLGAAECDPEAARGSKSGLEWVRANVAAPVMAAKFSSPHAVRGWFWDAWQARRGQVNLWADVAWPVEAKFLADCVADGRDGERDMVGPYPLLDVSTLVQATGLELPDTLSLGVPGSPHDPLYDARVSARKLVWAMERLGIRH